MAPQGQLEKFDRYTLLHRIAEGGMSEVFIAHDPEGDDPKQLVVIKRTRDDQRGNTTLIKAFVDEDAVLARLSHPGIIRSLDFGRADRRYFIALQHVWGESLTTLSQLCHKLDKPFPTYAAIAIGARVARALEHAHKATDEQGAPSPIIHRDVTLNNVLLSNLGEVKVLDFGIAKAKGRVTQTLMGEIKGNPEYLAPEQLQQKRDIAPAADVYQLGVLLYKLLVGRSPFPTESEGSFVRALLAGEVIKPSSVVRGFPPRIEQLLLKAMSQDPESRYTDGGEIAAALFGLLPPEWRDEQPRLAALFGDLAGPRHARQVAYIRKLLDGIAGDHADAELLQRDHGAEEPKRLHVELSLSDLPRPPELAIAASKARPPALPKTTR